MHLPTQHTTPTQNSPHRRQKGLALACISVCFALLCSIYAYFHTSYFLQDYLIPGLTAIQGETALSAQEYIYPSAGGMPISAEFAAAPDLNTPGRQTVILRLKHPLLFSVVRTAKLTVLPGQAHVEIPSGDFVTTITPDLFLENAAHTAFFAPSYTPPVTFLPGDVYTVPIQLENRIATCTLAVVDVTAPVGSVAPQAGYVNTPLPAIAFFTDIVDESEVTAEYAAAPDFSQEGTFPVSLLLTDAWGNTSAYDSTITLVPDTEAPVINGAADRMVFLNDTILYREGVTVTDNCDSDVPLEVDASAVNTREGGTYPVTYSATDRAGNHTSVTISVTVLAVTEEAVYSKADEVLATLVNDDMTPREKARAIHSWVMANIAYTGSSIKDSPLQGAYQGLFMRYGDCYTFCHTAGILLTRAGIENIEIHRESTIPQQHFWNLVNIDGLWYHFDTCPTPGRVDTFLFTASQAEEYTRMFAWHRPDYYRYSPENYPDIVP